MNLTENFTLEEMITSTTAKARGIDNTPNDSQRSAILRLCKEILQPIRSKYGKVIYVTSGFRCKELNKAVGGASTSQHLRGEAADINSADNSTLWNLILEMIGKEEIKVGQLIDEKKLRWIHISLPSPAHVNQILHI